MVIDFGPPMSESSTKISKFHWFSDSQWKFHKTRIENWLPIRFELGSPWLGICSHNYRLGTRWLVVPLLGIRSSTNNGVVPKIIISPSKKSWKIPGETSLPWNLASALKSQPHHPEWHRPPIEQKTNKVVGWIIYTHSTSTKLRYLARNKTESELPTLGVTQGNLGLTSLPHSLD